MKAPADKSPDNRRQADAHEALQHQGRCSAKVQFIDNRVETTSPRQLQDVANNSLRILGLAQLKVMMSSSPRSAAMQNLQAMADNCPRRVAQRQLHSRVQSAPPVGLQAETGDAVNSESVQRVEEEGLMQGKFVAESSAQLAQQPDAKPNNTGLPDNLKSGVESLSGLSLDNVKVHYNSPEPAQLNAQAYAQGTDIHVGPGQEQHLPHEAWHVVQQAQGRVKPTLQMKDGVSVNDDHGLEREADEMGGKAVADIVLARQELGGSIKSDPIDFPFQLQAILAPVIQLKGIEHDVPGVVPKGGRAGSVKVENIRGDTYGEAHNSPSIDDVFGWQQLHAEGHTLGNAKSTHYNAVRMHLWNGRLDGPGNETWNLAPGPAKTNSSMSAGPEMAAKLAVDSGKRIWLRTEVFYQNNGINANDFTNVVPNRMKMEWGYMLTATNNIAPRNNVFGNATAVKDGPAMPPAWDETIDQPAGAITEDRKNEYRALKDDQTATLDSMFETVSSQEKAQAFEVVIDALKLHIILTYQEVYMSMADATRSTVLTSLGLPDVLNLIKNVLHINQANNLISEIYYPLIVTGQTARLQLIYKNSATITTHDDQLVTGKWDLIQHLGDEVSWRLRSDYRYFKYVPKDRQPAILDAVVPIYMGSFLKSFPSGTSRREVFNNWAKSKGYTKPSEWLSFIRTKVGAKWFNEYKKGMKWHLHNEKSTGIMKRTPRTTKKSKWRNF